MRIKDISVTIVELPQIAPVAPYRSRLRTSSVTRSAIVFVETDEGLSGWGEYNVNFLDDIDGHQHEHDAQEWCIGLNPLNLSSFHQTCPLPSRLKSGIELALWDILGKATGMSVASLLGGMVRERVEVAACMGIQPRDRAAEIATYYVEQGFRTLKTKAGCSIQEDLEMVRGVRDGVGDRLKLRIDPNRGYSREMSAELARELEPYNLEFLEQPLPEAPLSDAKWLRDQTTVPIALNESVIDPASVIEIIRQEAADFILPDTHIAGGILPCVTIGRICEAASLPCIMHCGHDLGIKTAAMLHVAAACPAYSLANDSTYYGLADDVITERLVIEGGFISVPDRPDLGVEGDVDKIARYRIGK
jgi:L-alanine-DL-glutamate epimerase-like enolase superfamily enzyme